MEVNDEQEDLLSEVNFVPCVKFVKRGVAAAKSIADVSFPFKFRNFISRLVLLGSETKLESESVSRNVWPGSCSSRC